MTMRSIDSRVWSDGWVRKLNALDRYLFLYLLTNDHSTWCGVYELDIAMMAFESGIDRQDLERSMVPRLAPKVIYVDGWVYIPNWMKYHLSSSGTVSPQHQKGFDSAWKTVPEKIRRKIKELQEEPYSDIPPVYPMVGVSPSSSSIASSSVGTAEPFREVFVPSSEGEERVARTKKTTPAMQAVFDLFVHNPARLVWNGRTHQRAAAQVLHDTYGIDELAMRYRISQKHKGESLCPQIDDPSEFLEKMPKMETFLKRLST